MPIHQGGQRRTIMASCGWSAKGHPREVNNKLKIHSRYCEQCRNVGEPSSFDKDMGRNNGWGSVVGDKQAKKFEFQTIIGDGIRIPIKTDKVNINNIELETAMKMVEDIISNH